MGKASQSQSLVNSPSFLFSVWVNSHFDWVNSNRFETSPIGFFIPGAQKEPKGFETREDTGSHVYSPRWEIGSSLEMGIPDQAQSGKGGLSLSGRR